ncbi:MAG: T9SS type A sorting domain-containing protein [Bacteroidetes bacterium]|nr:T9SS type A sorting domain-containing protein [Bacteroidota bacterium]
MKTFSLLISILLIIQLANAQIPFQKSFGGTNTNSGNSVQQTNDNGYVAVGYTAAFGAGAFDVFIIKTDSSGNPVWKIAIGETSSDFANDVQQTSDSGFVVCGYSNSSFSGGFAGENIYLIKLNYNGSILWSKIIGGAGNERANSVRQTSDGGFLIAGTTDSWGAGGNDFYLVKTDASGNVSWTKTFGGAFDDVANSVKQTSDGGYIVAGETNSFGAGDIDFYLIKTDAFGNLTWSKSFGGGGGDWLYSVVQASDNGYVLGGYSISFLGAGEADAVVIKTDSLGNILWSKTYGEQYGDVASSVVRTNDNGYALCGGQSTFPVSMVDKGLLFKIDSLGNFMWANTFINSNDVQRSVCKTSDGGYILTGDRFPVSGIDLVIIKTNPNGTGGCNEQSTTLTSTNIFPQVSIPATLSSSGGTALTVTSISSSGGIVSNPCSCSSYFTLFPDAIPHNWIAVNQATGQPPITYSWSWGDGSASSSGPTPSHTYSTAGYYNICLSITDIAGCTSTYCDSSTYLFKSNGTMVNMNVILPTGINIIEPEKNTISFSPNPTSGIFVINFPENFQKGKIEIHNVLGELVYVDRMDEINKKEINLKNINSGVYFVKVFDGERSYCKKLIVEQD